ncbi:putative amidohydrolase YtcJ [Pontibacter aydingkolensis]|uniref:Amidohydrolase n=1 Tax=Pontibacter aydingkolensis TaxID=1911536 RepID=A0ABS7CW04_9BACT|nr:amidohydrolase [Pontibacter aydingkolensis]MBW7467975.1 amidohydrolase [Pontibacter aydingkolensis]
MTRTLRNFAAALLLGAATLSACTSTQTGTEQADLIVYNGTVYTVNDNFDTAEAFAVKDGKIIAVGTSEDIRGKYKAAEELDAEGKAVYPGFIDAHAHFYRYGLALQSADLVGTESFKEVVQKVTEQRQKFPDTEWITGRGWDQNDWAVKEFPTKDTLDKLFPDVPVILTRVDGHAALVNQKALDLAGITPKTKMVGGLVEVEGGKMTGILVDNAIDLVSAKIPEADEADKRQALKNAEANCFAVGLTSVDDAGLDKSTIDLMDDMHKKGEMQMRIYAMLNPSKENQDYYFKNGPYKTDRLNVRSFKVYSDGALGSRGANLLKPYADKHNHYGFLLASEQEFRDLAKLMNQHGFQMNTHAIGDSANRLLLNIYGEVLGGKNDKRWRIEHSQIINPADMNKFGQYSIIPSVQPTHATSDMYWAGDRLGKERIKHAYPFKQLLQQNGYIPLGTDFPVEDINPFYTFHSAVARQDAKNWPSAGFQMENALSREEALRGMTIWAAKSNFEETEKGSIEPGKFADFILVDKDLMKVKPEEMRGLQVLYTYLNGKQVYKK